MEDVQAHAIFGLTTTINYCDMLQLLNLHDNLFVMHMDHVLGLLHAYLFILLVKILSRSFMHINNFFFFSSFLSAASV
ncbi:hypothetical protein ACJX0J_032251, partial [Zea mays]